MGGQKTGLVVMQCDLNARRYIDDVLRPHVIPSLHNRGCKTPHCFDYTAVSGTK